MDAAVERRDVDENRVPLDSLVELSHEGFTESFEADGVNVSAGGLSMRASYLPSVGARLRCRIPNAPAGGHIEAGAEVVWSTDKGPHTGEFGLRFLDIDDVSARAIHAMLTRGPYVPPSPGGVLGAEDTLDEARQAESVSLAIDGVSDAIRASVVARDPDILTVSQELPFLRLATGVTVHQDGRRGRIEGIDLTLDGDTPKLLIDIVFEEAAAAGLESVASDTTIPDFLPLDHAPIEALAPVAREELTPAEPQNVAPNVSQDVSQDVSQHVSQDVHTAQTAVDLSSPPARQDEGALEVRDALEVAVEPVPEATVVADAEASAPQLAEPRIVRVPEVAARISPDVSEATEQRPHHEGELEPNQGALVPAAAEGLAALATDPDPAAPAAMDEQEDAASMALGTPRGGPLAVKAAAVAATLRARVQVLRPRIVGAFAKAGPSLAKLRCAFGPRTAALRAKVVAFFAMVRTEALPRLVASVRRTGRILARTALSVRDKVGQKVPALARRAKRRRKTAPPPTDSNVVGRRKTGRRAAAAAPKKDRRRTLVVSAIAFCGVATAVWALTPGGETVGAADPLAGHQSIAVATPAPAPVAAPSTAALAPNAAAAVGTDPVVVAPVVGEPAMPRAVGEGSREAGPMPAPTFPSLSEGARPQAPQALPEGSPYAVDVREGAAPAAAAAATEGAVFGAPDVADGRSFLIRMSQPVTVVRGTARADGFTVEVPSSLSLDRAGPIASSHPLVERSMILNRGDHSELTITFVSGHSPAYRVSARGSAIEVLIARR